MSVPVEEPLNGMLYLYEGSASLLQDDRSDALQRSAASLLGDGDEIRLEGGDAGARVLLIAGLPINEPVVQYGPFVMNSREEIEQTLRDYRDGRLTA